MVFTPVTGNAAVGGVEVLPATSLDQGLVGYWQLDEGYGTAAMDASGSSNDGTLRPGAGWTGGRFGAAVSFDGVAGYLAAGVAGLPAANAPQSISCWLSVPGTPSGVQNILSLTNDPAHSAIQLGFRNGRVGTWQYGGSFLVSAVPPAAGAWHHYLYSFDGTIHRLFIDGVQVSTSTATPQTAAPTKLEFARWTGGNEYLRGSLDNVRIYNRALTASEVQTLAVSP